MAGILQHHLGAHPVDADAVVLTLLSRGSRPARRWGWLTHVEAAVRAGLEVHAVVSVEATGAYDSDWRLAERLVTAGAHLVTMWIHAPEDVALGRLAARAPAAKVHVPEQEARWVHRAAFAQARKRRFCVTIDTVAPLDGDQVVEAVRPHLSPAWCRGPRRCGPHGLAPTEGGGRGELA